MEEQAYFFRSCSVRVLDIKNFSCSCSVLVREQEQEREHVLEQYACSFIPVHSGPKSDLNT